MRREMTPHIAETWLTVSVLGTTRQVDFSNRLNSPSTLPQHALSRHTLHIENFCWSVLTLVKRDCTRVLWDDGVNAAADKGRYLFE